MRRVNPKNFQNVLHRLESFADGIAQHQNEKKFPATLVENERRKMKSDLEAARLDYEKKQREADQASDKFQKLLKEINVQMSKDIDTLRGFYGKDNQVVADFGVSLVSKNRTPRKQKAQLENKT